MKLVATWAQVRVVMLVGWYMDQTSHRGPAQAVSVYPSSSDIAEARLGMGRRTCNIISVGNMHVELVAQRRACRVCCHSPRAAPLCGIPFRLPRCRWPPTADCIPCLVWYVAASCMAQICAKVCLLGDCPCFRECAGHSPVSSDSVCPGLFRHLLVCMRLMPGMVSGYC